MGINKLGKSVPMWSKIFIIVVLGITFISYLLMGGEMKENNTALFFTGIEIQYETDEQKETIIQVLRDMLTLGEEELKKQEYPDYFRKGEKIEVRQVIYNHFVPDEAGKRLDDNFYKELITKEVRERIIDLLQKLDKEIEQF